MSKYFAKYLPVEGETPIGDKAIGSDGRIILCTKNNEVSIQEHWKKVKLFLCSRDIQVGDKIRYDSVPNKEWIIVEFGKERDGFQNLNHAKGCFGFKVIGEISPQATWVKDGDELDEGEWRPFKYPSCSNNKLEIKIRCKIKGLCGHFH